MAGGESPALWTSPSRPSCRSAGGATTSRRPIRDHQVVVVAGETGSGKTTQLPKICLELGRGQGGEARRGGGLIGHTQPRRIAARSVAERLASELETELGDRGRLPGAVHRPHLARHPDQGDDRRHPARRAPARPAAAPLRHDHHRRGPRAEPQHRLPARLPQAPAAAPARPEAGHHLGDDRPRALRPPLRRPGRARPRRSSRCRAVPTRSRSATGRWSTCPTRTDDEGEAVVRDQTEAIVDAVRELVREGPATSWCSCRASGRSATPPTRSPT